MRYDAFISYKHEPRDDEAAMRIQKDLEHFHIPGAIRQQTGRERVGRIFRDKEEMSLTADLGEEIKEALASSRFLIVICSPHTRESVWVGREIGYFLQTHDIDHILTVITEGEPEEVLPERLLEEGREPLSADYRLSVRNAHRQELPRIAASLLGCRYDDLIHRAQQYRLRRFGIAALAVAVGSAAAALYLLWNRTQISESLRRAQVSQAQYLSGEVESLLEEDRDVTAAQLALYTVPENQNLTPPQSWKALADASWAYTSQTASRSTKTKVVGELDTADAIQIFRTNRNQDQICAADASGHIYVWDAKQRKTVLSIQNTAEVHSLVLAGRQLLVGDKRRISAYDLSTGKRIWTMDGETTDLETDQEETSVMAVRMEGRIKHLSVLDPENGTVTSDIPLTASEGSTGYSSHLTVTDDGTCAALCTENPDSGRYTIQVCDLRNGKPLKTKISLYAVNEISFLENGDLLVRGSTDEENSGKNQEDAGDTDSPYETIGDTLDSVFCTDPASREIKWISDIQYNQRDHHRVKSGSFTYKDEDAEKKAVYVSAANVLQVYDAGTGKEIQRWELSDEVSFLGAPQNNGDNFQAVCSDGSFNGITMDKKDIFCVRDYLKKDCKKVLYCAGSEKEGGYFADCGSLALQYETGTYYDPGYEELSGKGQVLYAGMTEDAYVFVQYSQGYSGSCAVNIYDKADRKLRDTFKLEKKMTGPEDILGLTQDGKEMVYTDHYKTGVRAVSLEDGKSRTLPIPLNLSSGEEETTFNADSGTRMCMSGDSIFYISITGNFCIYDMNMQADSGTDASADSETAGASADSKTTVVSADSKNDAESGSKKDSKADSKENSEDGSGIGSGTGSADSSGIQFFSCFSDEEKKKEGENDAQAAVCVLSVSPDAQYGFVSFDEGTSLLLELKGKTVKSVIRTRVPLYTEVNSGNGSVDWDLSGHRLAVAGDREAVLCDLDGKILKEISYNGRQAAGLHFYQDQLLVAFMDGRLNRYALSDGHLLGSTQIDVSEEAAVVEGSHWTDRKDGTILLSAAGYANVMDTEEWEVRYSVPYCLLSDPENRLFFVGDGTNLGYFPEYSLNELMEKCRRAANYEEMDEETLARYGLTQRYER